MSYTNGYNATRVRPHLFGRLGWKDQTLSAANQESRSGRYFDDGTFHALVAAANIKATTPAQDWDAYFTGLQNAAITKCLGGVFNEPSYRDNRVLLYDRVNNDEELVQNQGRFCGVEIRIAPTRDIAVQIESAHLYFDGDVTFPLYLFKAGNVAPIKQADVTSVALEQTEVSLTDWVIKYPGIYYLGYFQSDLGAVKAIRERVQFNRTYCFMAQTITAAENLADFERRAISYTGHTYGLNLSVSSFTDFTEAIIQKADLFDEALGLQMAQMVMEAEFFSTESNATERKLKDSAKAAIHLELQGALPIPDSPQIQGLRSRIAKELQSVKANFFKKAKSQTITL